MTIQDTLIIFLWTGTEARPFILREVEMISNVFTDEFYQSQVAKFAPVAYAKNGVEVTIVPEAFFRCDGIFYKNLMRLSDFPVFKVDGHLWMSITPMEAESHVIPIYLANDPDVKTVAVGGLGLGYYLAMIMGMEHLESIVVFEREQRVVDYFTDCFGTREGFSKIKFVVGNIHSTMRGYDFDLCYMDIYPGVGDPQAIPDKIEFCTNNRIKNYWFWTEERFLLSVVQATRKKVHKLTLNYEPVSMLIRDFANSEMFNLCCVDGDQYDEDELESYAHSNKLHHKPRARAHKPKIDMGVTPDGIRL